jgi:hypothetical protein
MRIAIGLPSYQEAASIAHVTSEVDAGLLRIAELADCVIVNVDGESPDQTARIFLETPTRCRKQSLITTPHRGKGSNVFNILHYCREHEVAAAFTARGILVAPDNPAPRWPTSWIIRGY